MQEIGKQYPKDDQIDKSGFLKKARRHQSEYRANKLNLPFDKYGNYLAVDDATKGSNFYPGFDVLKNVKDRYKRYSRGLYANMLRSEHIPFNLFVPFNLNNESKVYCGKVLNEFLNDTIKSINRIEIEYVSFPDKQLKKESKRLSKDAEHEDWV